MSHFSVLVVTKEEPSQELLEAVLMPWHEYECTGIRQYLEKVDITKDVEKFLDEDIWVGKDALGNIAWRYSEPPSEPLAKPADITDGPVSEITKMKMRDTVGMKIANTGQDLLEKLMTAEFGELISEDGKYYDETNPNAKWDWWVVGGRWGNFLLDKDGIYCDSLQKSRLDKDTMQKLVYSKAVEEYAKAKEVIKNRPVKSWPQMVASYDDIKDARAAYHAQEVIKDFANEFGPFADVENYLKSEEEFIAGEIKQWLCTFAVVYNGTWNERGSMGWFGCVKDESASWPDDFEKLYSEIPDDYYLTVVDCHI